MKLKNFLIEVIFWSHLVIVLLWFGLFLIPTSFWQNKVTFHFWFIIIITTVQLLWGLALYRYTKKIDIICPLTSLMQWMRGFSLKTKENFGHSFIAEILERLGVKVSYNTINILLLISIIVVSVQYFFFN